MSFSKLVGTTNSLGTSFQELIKQRNFRLSQSSSLRNTDLNYRPAPVVSEYDLPGNDSSRFSQYRGLRDPERSSRYDSRDSYNRYKPSYRGYKSDEDRDERFRRNSKSQDREQFDKDGYKKVNRGWYSIDSPELPNRSESLIQSRDIGRDQDIPYRDSDQGTYGRSNELCIRNKDPDSHGKDRTYNQGPKSLVRDEAVTRDMYTRDHSYDQGQPDDQTRPDDQARLDDQDYLYIPDRPDDRGRSDDQGPPDDRNRAYDREYLYDRGRSGNQGPSDDRNRSYDRERLYGRDRPGDRNPLDDRNRPYDRELMYKRERPDDQGPPDRLYKRDNPYNRNALYGEELPYNRNLLNSGGHLYDRDGELCRQSIGRDSLDLPAASNDSFKGLYPPKRPREDPINIDYSPRFKATCPDLSDDSLPSDLKLMFQPLFCKLCTMKLSSNSMARLHYKSKNHEKKIRAWLVEYAKDTGTPLHPRATPSNKKKGCDDEDEANSAKYFYCGICDLRLSGKLHAESHYMGKNHQKAILLGKTPKGSGFYDNEGHWIRLANVDAEHQDSFGIDFGQFEQSKKIGLPVQFGSSKGMGSKKLSCEICEITVTSQDQLQMHLNGIKHMKKLKLMGGQDKGDSQQKTSETPVYADDEDEDNSEEEGLYDPFETSDLSEFRTPTGHYYCEPCNKTVNSESQLTQHLNSMKHKRKTNSRK